MASSPILTYNLKRKKYYLKKSNSKKKLFLQKKREKASPWQMKVHSSLQMTHK